MAWMETEIVRCCHSKVAGKRHHHQLRRRPWWLDCVVGFNGGRSNGGAVDISVIGIVGVFGDCNFGGWSCYAGKFVGRSIVVGNLVGVGVEVCWYLFLWGENGMVGLVGFRTGTRKTTGSGMEGGEQAGQDGEHVDEDKKNVCSVRLNNRAVRLETSDQVSASRGQYT